MVHVAVLGLCYRYGTCSGIGTVLPVWYMKRYWDCVTGMVHVEVSGLRYRYSTCSGIRSAFRLVHVVVSGLRYRYSTCSGIRSALPV